jgi:hypothetical protein
MTDETAPDELSPRERAARRRRLAEVFGDVLPERTAEESRDDREGAERRTEDSAQDAWLRSQVPPHHGRV